MNRKALIGVGVVIAVLVGVTAWAFWPQDATEVTEQDALDDYRNRSTTTAATTDPATTGSETTTPATEPVPPDGVYTYTASGQEVVKLGPFPEETRTVPASVTAVVVGGDDGCFDYKLNLFEEHVEDSTFCSDGAGLSINSYAKHQRIGPTSPTVNIACDPGVILNSESAINDLLCKLSLDGGPVPVNAEFAGVATSQTRETLTIGGEDVEVAPVTVEYDITGSVSGTWTEKLWLTDSNLVVRMERSLDLDGPASFNEQFELELTSLTPTT